MEKGKNHRSILWCGLGILFIAYGSLVLSVGSGSGFYMFWYGLAVMSMLLALAAHFNILRLLIRPVKLAILIVILAGMLFFLGTEAVIISGFSQSAEADLDAVIVLGAQVHKSGPSVTLRYRLDRAIEYLNENPDTVCIVSGGQGSNEPFPEAEGMATYLESKGISSSRIVLERESTSTRENITNSLPLLPENATVGLITNDFHMFRALQIARDAGLDNVSGIPADSNPLFLPNNLCREFFAEIKFLLLSVS